jgi:hypothetical protein
MQNQPFDLISVWGVLVAARMRQHNILGVTIIRPGVATKR